jgi:hypothetical protein
MSNKHLFDEYIKEQFEGYSPKVPSHIWKNIVAKNDRKKPIGFWYNLFTSRTIWFIAFILLVATGVTYEYVKNTPSTGENIATNTKHTDTGTAAPENLPGTNNNMDANTIIANTRKNIIPGAAANQSSLNTLPNRPASDNERNDATGKVYLPNKIKTASVIKKANRKIAITDTDNNTIEDFTLVNNSLSPTVITLQKLNFIAEKILSEKMIPALQKRILFDVKLPDCPTIEKDAAGNKTYIEFYGGPDAAFRSLSDTANSAYLQKTKESIRFLYAYSAGMRYTRVFSNGMSIRTGINFSQINEKFSYSQGNIVQVVYIIDNNGDTTGSYTTTGTRYKTTINKFKTIDIPIIAGYELGNGKLHANINAGAIINLYSWQKGEVLDASLKPVSITTGQSNSPYRFKTNIGVGFIGSLSVYYKLNERMHILAEPYFRYNLSPMSKDNLTFKQKYNTTGLRLGLRVDL